MYSKCFLLVMLSISVFGVTGKRIHVNVDEYYTCIPLQFKPPNAMHIPRQSIEIFGELVPVTRHLIIPFNTLSKFINLVLSENPFESGLGAYLAINLREIYRYFKENTSASAFLPLPWPQWPNPAVLFLYEDKPISFEGSNASLDIDYRMFAALTWLPGNLFYGPPTSRRAHDPGDNLEVDAEKIVGNEAFKILRRVYENMQNYINNSSQQTVNNYDTIIADLIKVASATNRPYEFNPEDWIESGNSGGRKLYDIKKSSVAIEEIKTPQLRKRSIIVGDVTDEFYLRSIQVVCDEYLKHMKPKFNTNFTQVNIDDNVTTLFVYSIDNRHFLYGYNEKSQDWFIKRMDQYGRVGKVSQQGTWQNNYAIQIHYEIDGKHFLFGHNLETRYWFIQQLNAGGSMGRETHSGSFYFSYKIIFYFSVNGQHYLYKQTESNRNWLLRKLNSDGTMGPEMSHGRWVFFYDKQFPLKVGNEQYVAGHNTDSKFHFIRDINAGNVNSMGNPNVWTSLDRSYLVFFPFTFAEKTYFFGHDPNSKHFFIRQVFGSVVEEKDIDIGFAEARPFNINGNQFFYAKLKGSSHWYQFHFDFYYFDE